jgi:RNA polymerase sigma-70 factor (ECF subfamily)
LADLSAEEWTTAWVEQYGDAIVRFLESYVGDPGDAQDLAQEVFSRLYRQRRDHPRQPVTVSWLYTVARRLAIDHYRSVAARPRLWDGTTPHEPAAASVPVEEQLHVRALLEQLPPGERQCLILFYFQDWPLDMIARELGITPATVRVRLHRARERFRTLWAKEEVSDGGHTRA